MEKVLQLLGVGFDIKEKKQTKAKFTVVYKRKNFATNAHLKDAPLSPAPTSRRGLHLGVGKKSDAKLAVTIRQGENGGSTVGFVIKVPRCSAPTKIATHHSCARTFPLIRQPLTLFAVFVFFHPTRT
jgi:hypothetical protein